MARCCWPIHRKGALVRSVGLGNHIAENALYLGGEGLVIGSGGGTGGALAGKCYRRIQRGQYSADGRVCRLQLRLNRADVAGVLVDSG
jgi:hypothetical protein